jgi:malate synthase
LIEIRANVEERYDEVLTDGALQLVGKLHEELDGRRRQLLDARQARQAELDAGGTLDFVPAPEDFQVAPNPDALQDRRVEITGPTSRKMVINALNSGARGFMADFEDSNSPYWANMVGGQVNLADAVRGHMEHSEGGKDYRLAEDHAVLLVRPRGLHLPERHLQVNGAEVAGAFVDFGLYVHGNAEALLERGRGPYFYIPKLESAREAALWRDAFLIAEEALGLDRGTIKATVLIETLPAAFEMDEILYELREHSVGLNCGRWDYIFSAIKTQRNDPAFVLPDRGQVTMDKGFLQAYVRLLIHTCHRRGAHAMGGMAAQIPIKDDPQANEAALDKVRADKLREVREGHDGTWVAHPGLVPVARQVFDDGMPSPNQLSRLRDDVRVSADMMLAAPAGTRTETGLRHNIRVGIQYVEAWLGGQGAVPIYNLMEDAATAEICRTQIWQWLRHRATLEDGRVVTREIVDRLTAEEFERIRSEVGAKRFDAGRFDEARDLFVRVATTDPMIEFLTLPAYETLVMTEPSNVTETA